MKNIKNKAFTLVELLVVITILAIISVVAYQNFWWAVDKAVSWRKINDIVTIESSLKQYQVSNAWYPKVDEYSTNNLWWYNENAYAIPSNKIITTVDWDEIVSLTWSLLDTPSATLSIWGWRIYWTWALWQIWAKWTISRDTIWKSFISKDLYDPEVWDIKVRDLDHTTAWDQSWKLIDKWIGRYVYSVYKKSKWNNYRWSGNKWWDTYNIAFTIKKENSDEYITKIVWDYDEQSCFTNKHLCPKTLIWTMSWWTIQWVLEEWNIENWDSNLDNYWVPYAARDFAVQ